MKKQFGLFAIMLLVLSTFAPSLASADEPDFETQGVFQITNIKVNGVNADLNRDATYNWVNVERGTAAYVEVYFRGNSDITDFDEISDVTVSADINGYDDDIEDETDEFDVEPNVIYRKVLKLDIPEDIDANDNYALRIEISNNRYSERATVGLRVQEQEDNVVIRDVIFDPGLNVDAGESFTTRVRAENLGDERVRDVRVEVSVPALGIQTASYLDDLTTQYDDEDEDNSRDQDDDDFNSAETTERMSLKIPQSAEAGQYDLFVTVEYNRGRDSVEERYTLTVGGSAGNVMVSAVDSEKTVAPGKGVAYQVSLTNLGSSQTFNFDVEGVSSWGTARIDPSTVTISEDGKADVFVYVTAAEDAEATSHQFNLVVKSGSNTVKKVPLVANVQAGLPAFDGFRQGLEIGFAILLVILVILGIIIAARRIGKDSNNDEPLLEEDQTYY